MSLNLTKLVDNRRKVNLDLGKPNAIQAQVLNHFRDGKRVVLMVSGRQAGKVMWGLVG